MSAVLGLGEGSVSLPCTVSPREQEQQGISEEAEQTQQNLDLRNLRIELILNGTCHVRSWLSLPRAICS